MSELLDKAVVAWRNAGIDANGVSDLRATAEPLVHAVVFADFDVYLRLVKTLELRDRGQLRALRVQFAGWGLYDEASLTISDQDDPVAWLRVAWNNPKERVMDIGAIGIADTSAGIGLIIGEGAWPYDGVLAQFASFVPPEGPLSIDRGDAIYESPESAFLEFSVRTGDGTQGRLRFNFYRDERGRWVPLNLVTGTESGRPRALLPLL